MKFEEFKKIQHIGKARMAITQKIHGTNAQVAIFKNESGELDIKAGSRTRWLTPEDDNYGFARFIHDNRDEFISLLGEGRHYGEWAGAGINSGEGLQEKILVLFNWYRWKDKELPKCCVSVPMLYFGAISLNVITDTMERLKQNGSYLAPGFMRPEGVVVEIDGQLYKNCFDAEETAWKQPEKKPFDNIEDVDVSYLLQPIRLTKLLSKDERYMSDFPASIPRICHDYVADLEAENQFKATNDDDLRREKKALGKQIFYFIKSVAK